MNAQHSNFTVTTQTQIKSWTIQRIALQILRLLAEDVPLKTKRSYEGEPSPSEWSEASSVLPPSDAKVHAFKNSRAWATSTARNVMPCDPKSDSGALPDS
jgi:hypothetical protein